MQKDPFSMKLLLEKLSFCQTLLCINVSIEVLVDLNRKTLVLADPLLLNVPQSRSPQNLDEVAEKCPQQQL
jgi:hypothetical protein